MFQLKHPSKQKTFAIYIAVAWYVLFICLYALFTAKDRALFEAWRDGISSQLTLRDYTAMRTGEMFSSLLIPAGYAVYLYFAVHKMGLTKLAYWVWGLLLFYTLLMRILLFQWNNVFWWGELLCLSVIFILHADIEEKTRRKSRR